MTFVEANTIPVKHLMSNLNMVLLPTILTVTHMFLVPLASDFRGQKHVLPARLKAS